MEYELKTTYLQALWGTILMLAILCIPPVLAQEVGYSDCTIYGNCKPVISGTSNVNYSTINVNYSGSSNETFYWQGYTPQSYNTTFIYGKYVPYTGATDDVKLGAHNIYADKFMKDGLSGDYNGMSLTDDTITFFTNDDYYTEIDNLGNWNFYDHDLNTTGSMSARYFKGNGSLLSDVCLSNGTGCVSSSGNPFDQSLNKSDTVIFYKMLYNISEAGGTGGVSPYYIQLNKDSGMYMIINNSGTGIGINAVTSPNPTGITYSDANTTVMIGSKTWGASFSNNPASPYGYSNLYIAGYGSAFSGSGNGSITGKMTASKGFSDGTCTIASGILTGGVSATYSGLGKFGNISAGNVCYSNGTGCNSTSLLTNLNVNGTTTLSSLNISYSNATATVRSDAAGIAFDKHIVLENTGGGDVAIELRTGTANGEAYQIGVDKSTAKLTIGSQYGGTVSSIFNLDYLGNIVLNTAGFSGGGVFTTNSKANSGSGIFNIFSAGLDLGNGAGLVGDGLSYLFRVENSAGAQHDAGKWIVKWANPTDGAEIASTIFQNMNNGAFADALLLNGTNAVFYGNATINNLINLNVITLPACGSSVNGSIGRNSTGVYGCKSSGEWSQLF